MSGPSQFSEFLARALENPETRAAYEAARLRPSLRERAAQIFAAIEENRAQRDHTSQTLAGLRDLRSYWFPQGTKR